MAEEEDDDDDGQSSEVSDTDLPDEVSEPVLQVRTMMHAHHPEALVTLPTQAHTHTP